MLMLPFNFENGSDFRKGVQPSNQVEEQVVVAGPREGFALSGGAIHGGVHRRPSAGGKRQDPVPMSMRRHRAGSSTATRRQAAQARSAPRMISVGPSMRKTEIRMSGGSDAQSLAAGSAETDERGFLRWWEEAIGCIPGDLGK